MNDPLPVNKGRIKSLLILDKSERLGLTISPLEQLYTIKIKRPFAKKVFCPF